MAPPSQALDYTPVDGTGTDNRAILIVDHKLSNVSHAYRMEYLMPVETRSQRKQRRR